MGKKQERKSSIHPSYQEVVFVDTSTGAQFLCKTALKPKGNKTIVYDGRELPVCEVSVSSSSHPLFTGQKFVDTEGRISKFNKRYKKS